MNFFQFLADIFLQEMKNVLGISKLMKLNPRKLLETFYTKPEEFAKKLGEMDVRAKKAFSDSIKKAQRELLSQPLAVKKAVMGQVEALERMKKKYASIAEKRMLQEKVEQAAQEGSDFALLSSSWLVSGQWYPNLTGDVGDLVLTTKQGGSYIYPGVSLKVWEAMKKAKGRNGSGAGSVFWTMYLRGFRGGVIHTALAKVFKLTGVSAKVATPSQLRLMLAGGK